MASSPGDPWPRFRGNAMQTGRAPEGLKPTTIPGWTYPAKPRHEEGPGLAARGIFNSAVVDAAGNVYSGDASGRLSRIAPHGQGEVIHDTRALIDTTPLLHKGFLYVACGDGYIWRWKAGSPASKWFGAPLEPGAFINWFEGHLGVDSKGNIVAPNDNFRVYFLDPETVSSRSPLLHAVDMKDQTWSLACVDPASGRLFMGNNAMRVLDPQARNVYAFSADWQPLWSFATDGSVVASPAWDRGRLFAGSFDGYLHAFDAATGQRLWKFATGDHLYASPAILSNGLVVQASCDGCVYAVEPGDGTLAWRYDMPLRQPFRSSPAVGAGDRIWLGTGDGRMLVLDDQGMPLALHPLGVAGPRRQVNASPAVAPGGMVIGDSEGALHLVPWRVASGPSAPPEAEPAAPAGWSAALYPTDPWGVVSAQPPHHARPGEALCFTLDARESDGSGSTRTIGLLDTVQAWPASHWHARISGDRRYVIVEQGPGCTPGEVAPLKLHVTWRHSPEREGLRMHGGVAGPAFTTACEIPILRTSVAGREPPAMLWFQRIAMSLPALLPSYNQIGFETLVYGITRVCALKSGEWLYLCTGWLPDGSPDIATGVRFPMRGRWDAATGTLQLRGQGVYSALNGFATHMHSFALTCWFDADGTPSASPVLRIAYAPSGVHFYGPMLEALGMGDDQHPIEVFGSGEIGTWPAQGPALPGLHWTLDAASGDMVVHCGPDVRLSPVQLALVVQDEHGEPVTMDYARATGRVTVSGQVLLRLSRPAGMDGPWSKACQVWVVADGVPVPARFGN